MINIKCITTGVYQENCYLLWNNNNEGLIIDPGEEFEKIKQAIVELEINIIGYLCTHAHADHISALKDLHDIYPANIAMHSDDWFWAFSSINQSPPYYGVPKKPNTDSFLALENQDEWNIGSYTFDCIHTPGHTPGSCSFYFKEHKILISGDTLFKNSCGRTDMRGGSGKDLKLSLKKLKKIPKEVVVYPGHGEKTTIYDELENNFYMK